MQRLGDFFPEFLDHVAANEELCLIFLKQLWPDIVGKEVAQQTRPLAYRRKVLTLAVASQTWERELSDLGDPLLKAINLFWKRRLVERIRFEAGPQREVEKI